jgi:dipeptidyl-peptidase-4
MLLCFSDRSTIQAQEPLSIQEAVMEAYTTFYPERVEALSWIPGSTDYSFVDPFTGDRGSIMRGYLDGRPPTVIVDLIELARVFQKSGFVQPESMPRFQWMDGDHILFDYKGQYWRFNPEWEYVEKWISCTKANVNRQLSPDMSKVASTVGNDLFYSNSAQDSIRITKNPPNIVSGQAVSRYEFGIDRGIWWSPDSQAIAYYEKDESQVSDYSLVDYREVPAIPANTKYPMAGQSSESVKVKVFDIRKQKSITLETDGAEDQYLTSVAWSADGKSIYVGHLSRDQNSLVMKRYDATTGAMEQELFREEHDRYVEPEYPVYPLKGTRGEFIYSSERDGYQHLYHYAADGKLIAQLTKGERVMKDILHHDEKEGYLVVSGTDGALEEVVYKVDIKRRKMERVTQRPGVHKAMVSDNGDFLIDVHTSLTVPRDVRILDMKGRTMREILSAKDPLEGRRIGQTELLELRAEDGTQLHARMIKPSDFDPSQEYPVLVYVYGGPHVQLVENRWMAGASLWMHHMAERGYIIFTVDTRGSADRGRDFEQASHRNMGAVEVADVMSGVEYLQSLPYVDEDRMAVHGWSYGGYMTLNMMLRKPGTFQVGVPGGAVVDWRFYEVMYTERYMDDPVSNADGFASTGLAQYAANLEGDLLMIHCTNDDVVVPQHFMIMLNAFINADEQVDVMLYPGHAHNVRGQDRVHLMTKVLDYIDEHLRID